MKAFLVSFGVFLVCIVLSVFVPEMLKIDGYMVGVAGFISGFISTLLYRNLKSRWN